MTRQEIIKGYTVDQNGIIRSPGKFEGEMLYVPHFYEIWNDGFADTGNGTKASFKVTQEDREMFPEIPKRKRTVRLCEDGQGFVREF